MIIPFSSPCTIGLRAHIEMTLWRVKHLHKLDEASIKELSMEVLVPKLRERDIVKTAGHLMRIMGLACNPLLQVPVFMDPRPCEICPIPPRVFLAAMMMVSKPEEIFKDPMEGVLHRPLEVAVLQSAKVMLDLVGDLTPHLVIFPYFNAEVVLAAFTQFETDYQAWKQVNEAMLTSRITRSLIALYTALAQYPVVPVDPADILIRGELVTQIRRLRSKFVQLNSAEDLVNFDRSLDYILGNNILVHRTLLA